MSEPEIPPLVEEGEGLPTPPRLDPAQELVLFQHLAEMEFLAGIDQLAKMKAATDKEHFPENFLTILARLTSTYLGALRNPQDTLGKYAAAFNYFYAASAQREMEGKGPSDTLH